MPPKPLPSETKARKAKRWTLKELREEYAEYAVGENHFGHGYIGCFLDSLEPEAEKEGT